MVDVLLGLQWGDEGKGKIVDFLAKDYDIIARFQGGPNAGHTLYLNEKKVVLHTIPSGVFHKGILNVIGNGVVIDPISFEEECNEIKNLGVDLKASLLISERAHIILPTHKALDRASELIKGTQKIGSTLKGIGPTYMDKTGRNGLRVGDILKSDFKEKYEALKHKHQQMLESTKYSDEFDLNEEAFFNAVYKLKQYKIIAAEYWLNAQLKEGKKILAEGAQGTMLDIDFGTYPFVTSSNTVTAGLCIGLGIAPKFVGRVYGISKAYCTRVGGGPFPTELLDEVGDKLRELGHEFGATTGRPRRCGWNDLVALNYACMINGVTDIILTKADVLDGMGDVKVCESYKVDNEITKEFPYNINPDNVVAEYTIIKAWDKPLSTCKSKSELPETFMTLVETVQRCTGVPVAYVSNGVGRDQLIVM